jgi:hypothetical protein
VLDHHLDEAALPELIENLQHRTAASAPGRWTRSRTSLFVPGGPAAEQAS